MLKAISKRSLFLLICDCVAIISAYAIANIIRSGAVTLEIFNLPPFLYISFLVVPSVFYVFDLYYPFKYFDRSQTLVDIILAVLVCLVILATASYLDRSLLISRLIFVYAALALVPFVYISRLFYDFLFRSHVLDKRALIIGTGPLAEDIVNVIKSVPHSGLEIIGLVYEKRKPKKSQSMKAPVIGGMGKLISLIDWYNIDVVILALNPDEKLSEANIMSELMMRKVAVTSAIHLHEKIAGEIPYLLVDNHYLLSLMSQVRTRPYLKLKRLIDLVAGTGLLIALLPALFLAILLLSLTGPKNVFFVQKRVGRDGEPFHLLKLRTMTTGRKSRKVVTRLGRLLRRFRIDEFPQLINVLKGEMSLIGPRPEVPYFVARSRKKTPFYDTVFAIKPGLTGWAQVNHTHVTSVKDYDKKFRYNLYYLKNISLTLDMVILLRTIRVVVFGKGK